MTMITQSDEPAAQSGSNTFGEISELARKAQLGDLVNRTMSKATAALLRGDPDEALKILQGAGGKYAKLGGPPPSNDPRYRPALDHDHLDEE